MAANASLETNYWKKSIDCTNLDLKVNAMSAKLTLQYPWRTGQGVSLSIAVTLYLVKMFIIILLCSLCKCLYFTYSILGALFFTISVTMHLVHISILLMLHCTLAYVSILRQLLITWHLYLYFFCYSVLDAHFYTSVTLCLVHNSILLLFCTLLTFLYFFCFISLVWNILCPKFKNFYQFLYYFNSLRPKTCFYKFQEP